MKNTRFIYIVIVTIVIGLIFYIAKESFFQPGMERFEGKYEELATYRNKNNTGPIVRLYAVRVLGSDNTWMEEYGNSLPHTKYGRTLVFFFDTALDQEISLSPKEPYFNPVLKPHLSASYEKTPMGEVRFKIENE